MFTELPNEMKEEERKGDNWMAFPENIIQMMWHIRVSAF